tara:strand:- start:1522 stop:3378 length:1857 start_codon:yes stop_codon:yes gene_type:complete
MNEDIKYIFFIFLGIIFYLIFINENLIEGYDKINNECNINRIENPCSLDSEPYKESDGWTTDDVNNYKNEGIRNYDLSINSCQRFNKICFFNDDDNEETILSEYPDYEGITIQKITTKDQCETKCNSFSKCRSFSFFPNISNDGTSDEHSRCCLYTSGFSGNSVGDEDESEGDDEQVSLENCYSLPTCENGKYYSFSQCQYESNGILKKCGFPEPGIENSRIYTYDNENCNLEPEGTIQDCSVTEDNNEYCKCGGNEQNICKKNECNSDVCGGSTIFQNEICNYGVLPNSNTLIQDTDILDNECSCGLINENYGTYESEEIFLQNNVFCNSSNSEYKYCSFSKDNLTTPEDRCKTLQDCNSSDTLLTESCGYDDENGIKQICKYTDENGIKNTMYNENILDGPCKTINRCDSDQMDRKLEDNEFCFCPVPDSENFNLCSSGKICNASGCMQETLNCPINNSPPDPNSESNDCIPPICSYYSQTNKDPIINSCICDTDTRQENYVCDGGYYCLPSENEHPGCRPESYIKRDCIQYSLTNKAPLTINCKCGLNNEGQPNICQEGKYCINNTCRSCSGTDIPDPENPINCISLENLNKRNEEPFFIQLTNKFERLFNNLKI